MRTTPGRRRRSHNGANGQVGQRPAGLSIAQVACLHSGRLRYRVVVRRRIRPEPSETRSKIAAALSAPYSRGTMIRVVLAEDTYLVREGIQRLLEPEADIELAAACADLPSLLEAIEAEKPDVVLTDIRMPPTSQDEGIQVADRLRETSPGTGVVVLSQFAAPEYALALLEKGADRRAYLLKDRVGDAAQLAGAIREVARGGSVIDSKIVEALVAARARGESPLDELTPRERETLEEMAQGKNNAAIAASLVITEQSVEKMIHSILRKLGVAWQPDVNRRVKAVLLYLAEREG